MPCCDQPVIWKLYNAVEFISCDWSIETYHYQGWESVSDSIHLCDWDNGIDVVFRLCMHYIYDLYHNIIIHHGNYVATGDVDHVVKLFITYPR